jgi:hypothetical protein
MAYKQIDMELIVIADDAEAVVAERSIRWKSGIRFSAVGLMSSL